MVNSAGMASEGAVLEAVADKKRVREAGEDAVEGGGNGVAPAVDKVNGAAEDVEKVEKDVKRAKKDEAEPAAAPMDVEVKRIVDSATTETATVKGGKCACVFMERWL